MTLLDTIGNTPLIKLNGVNIKLEHLNPSGSIKDRIAKYIIERAERTGKLKKGYTVVEATSGNTGIAFSMVCALKGYKMVVIMPRGMSEERARIIRGYGGRIIFVKKDCVQCAVAETHKFRSKVYFPRQFENDWNFEDHEKFLGKEIIKQVKKVDAFVAGVGTGGTLIGVGKALKKKFPKVKIIALEPEECPLLSKNRYGRHKIYGFHKGFTCRHHGIEGIGDGFIPKIVERNRKIIDEVIRIRSKDAINMCKNLAKRGYFVGPSSGANFLGALKLKKKYKNVVTLFPDRGTRYLSEGIFN